MLSADSKGLATQQRKMKQTRFAQADVETMLMKPMHFVQQQMHPVHPAEL
jgi:hypothetical protein